ncbi:sigma 54-interacting transcriptional regulator [Archangium violaceum]|uniref:sigma 54-interacting transcriptional regulator n=1 Tax=Archangium violaceum TaxID=83451 RepID=UPI001EF0F29D|nr:sigma 54-interacting transcriptional regulator [Archangium violaceum]
MYLLVLEGNSSSLRSLPRAGTLRIGRDPSSDIRLEDPSVSRRHAELVVGEGMARLNDLGSHNGARINGERVVGGQVLYSGDVVTLGNVTLVLHGGEGAQPERPSLDEPALRLRLSEELERVLDYERAVSVVVLEPGSSHAPLPELVRALGASLRMMDVVCQAGSALWVLLPELEEEAAEDAAQGFLEVLSPLAPQMRAGLATAPQDGLNADALIAAARAVALAASPGSLRVSDPRLYRLELGERSLVVADAAMVRTYELLRRLAASTLPVLIHGETGSGKENAAWAVHYWSPRVERPFVALNCSAIPESLAESELFGYERGAFSGADKPKAGLLERANGGTLFLDEVAELSLSLQAKLLRALEQKRITRLGDSREREVDLRIVAATHRVLAKEVEAGRFREDLFFRLSAAVVMLPPLRDRPRELPLLARAFLEEACARLGRSPLSLSAGTMGVLSAHSWKGNVRELRNVLEYAAATAPGPILEPSHLPDSLRAPRLEGGGTPAPPAPRSTAPVPHATPAGVSPRAFRPIAEELRELERQRMLEALEATEGVQRHAAQLIGMPLRTFAFKLKKYKIQRKVTLE